MSIFTSEYCLDGRQYTTAGSVTKLNASHKYSFTAPLAISGTVAFRIKVTDRDGTVKDSEVRTLNTAGSSQLSVYPNPVSDFIYIQKTGSKTSTAQVCITDIRGRSISRQQVTAANSRHTLKLSGLKFVIYFIT